VESSEVVNAGARVTVSTGGFLEIGEATVNVHKAKQFSSQSPQSPSAPPSPADPPAPPDMPSPIAPPPSLICSGTTLVLAEGTPIYSTQYSDVAAACGGNGGNSADMFDGLPNSFWETTANTRYGWVGIRYAQLKRVTSYRLSAGPHGEHDRMPHKFRLDGSLSSSCATWTTLDSVTRGSWASSEQASYVIDAPGNYYCYRIVAQENTDSCCTRMSGLDLTFSG